MSKKLSRRQFLKVAGVTTLSGFLAACAPQAEPTTVEEPVEEPMEEPVEEPMEEPVEEPMEEPVEEPAPEEVAVLDYYWVANQDTDQRPAVEAAINEYIQPLINANVVFHLVGWGDWAAKAVTGLQAGEKMDIFFTADWWHYMQLSTEGLFNPLNDPNSEYGNLIDQYGKDIVSSLNPAFITGTQIDGINYAIPTNKELTVPEGFLYNLTWAEEIGMTPEDAAAIKQYRDMEPWLEKAKAAYPNEYPYLTDGRDGFSPWPQDLASGVAGTLINMKIAPDASGVWDETILSVMETDVTAETLGILREWYDKGWIHPDAGLTTFVPNDLFNAGKFFIWPMPLKGNNIKAEEMMNASGNPDLKVGEIYGQPKVNITTHAGGSMLAIPTTSEFPAHAMKYIIYFGANAYLQIGGFWATAARDLTIFLGLAWLIIQFYALPIFMIQERQSLREAWRNSLFMSLASPFYLLVLLLFLILAAVFSVLLIFPVILGYFTLLSILANQAVKDRLEAFQEIAGKTPPSEEGGKEQD